MLVETHQVVSNNIGIVTFLKEIGLVGKLVLGILLLFSIVSWGIILFKMKVFSKEKKELSKFLRRFRRKRTIQDMNSFSLEERENSLARIFISAYKEASLQAKSKTGELKESFDLESIERAMIIEENNISEELKFSLSFLATTASVTPFIGLFGTVWGIMEAFRQIGLQGSADLATVAPGIAEALINTAAGLFAAIPALIAYNSFSSKLKSLRISYENFITEVLNIFAKIKY